MIRLAPNGIFPIVFDADGKNLNQGSNTGFNRSGTIQGEGKWAGVCSLFIRLWGCNLNCKWTLETNEKSVCDTQEAISEKEDSIVLPVENVVRTIQNNLFNCKHVVITGGEPLLQKKALIDLLQKLKVLGLTTTLETNATIFSEEVLACVDLLSMSPKLSNAFDGDFNKSKRTRAICREVIAKSVAFYNKNKKGDFQLKFVVAKEDEITEIKSLLKGIDGITGDDILLMPLGGTWKTQQQNMTQTIEFCVSTGWRFAPRLHIMQWDDKRGV